jgi:Uncharacterized membrane protein, required for colicin V production
MNWLDALIAVVLAVSLLTGAWKGFMREFVGLAGWVAAFWLAWRFAAPLAGAMEGFIGNPMARKLVAYALVFILVLVVAALAGSFFRRLVQSSALSGTDRLLGAGFGALRALVLVLAAMILAMQIGIAHGDGWRQSRAVHWLTPLALQVRSMIPPDWLAPLAKTRPTSTLHSES